MHKGPYDDEPATIAKLSSFVADQNLRLDIGNASGSDPQDILPKFPESYDMVGSL